jgi:hypothetical protein
MFDSIRTYRGLEITPLVYPRKKRIPGRSYDYDAGFDASVRISRRSVEGELSEGRIFRVPGMFPFDGGGKARLASINYAEQVIDGKVEGQTAADL